jgi:hypothetical protein
LVEVVCSNLFVFGCQTKDFIPLKRKEKKKTKEEKEKKEKKKKRKGKKRKGLFFVFLF